MYLQCNYIHASNQQIEHLKQLINLCFHFCHIPNLLKIGTLFPVFKKKGDIKNSRNYRGITITPTYSKIIEKIIKEREKSKILLSQNLLQKGFTENSTLLLRKLFIEEFEKKKHRFKITSLQSNAAFDVVIHANLIRRLFQIGISKQSILLLQNFYQNAKSYIKWNGQISEEFFIIEQGVSQ